MSEPTSTEIAARIGIIAAAATGLWDEAAEQLSALDAKQLDKFYDELTGLAMMARQERRKANHR